MPISRSRALSSLCVLAVLALVVLSACAGGGASGPVPLTEIEFVPELGVDLDEMTLSSSGLYTMDLEVGTGDEARRNRRVTVHYIGWFPDGRAFDSSLATGEPAIFALGRGAVIRGWEEGLQGMRVGGKRRLVIPPRLAYGRRGLDDVVPSNAVLVFEIQLLDVGR